jgi:glycosyltransferase involved in cell wall biosynthesis
MPSRAEPIRPSRSRFEDGYSPGTGPIIAAIPAHNEERTIGAVVSSALQHVDLALVVDDGSSDGTATAAARAGAEVVRHERNTGKAVAITTALGWARHHAPSALILLDGDGQHDPADIPRLLEPILDGSADVVIGSRFLEIRNPIPYYRTVGQRVLNVATHLGSGQPCSDSQSGYRALSARAVHSIRLHERFLQGLAGESEMQFEIAKHGLRLSEIPIYVRYDERPRRSPVKHGFGVLYRVIVMSLQRRGRPAEAGLDWATSVAGVWAAMFGRRSG